MTLKKTLQYGIIAFLIWFVAFRPDAAARVAREIVTFIAQLGVGFGDFFTKVIS
ncbi:hypothetical protein [Dactylosporangium sp. CA-233914]|uniref:hypothetical protein n=1 Tax=Dactylosporangium sp. CA-233914 TaxID=3239934 RepID=UPI003D8AD8A9